MHDLVAVVGPGTAADDLLTLAEEVGAGLARRGVGVVCGGLAGVMEAACRGAKRHAGLTVGLLPGSDREAANGFVDVALPTGFGEGRNILVVRAAVAVIAVGGEYGTLSELAFALKLGRPVVGLRTWALHKDGRRREAFPTVERADEAVERALGALAHRPAAQGRGD
ncbi:MAG TPA: TIGR00725 family protein [Egibacteraceae bacterium]|nr:TIGR00725 family protein [Egibacteraceae bacterium]